MSAPEPTPPDPGLLATALVADPMVAVEVAGRLAVDDLHHLAAAVNDELRRRAIAAGDLDALIADAFETGFGRDGLAVDPWRSAEVIVCPGGLVSSSRTNHRCRFVSVDGVWIWESSELVREDKRSTPGAKDGFRAVALLPVLEGLALDVVTGRARGGAHQVDRVVSFEVRQGVLVEVAQRDVSARGLR